MYGAKLTGGAEKCLTALKRNQANALSRTFEEIFADLDTFAADGNVYMTAVIIVQVERHTA